MILKKALISEWNETHDTGNAFATSARTAFIEIKNHQIAEAVWDLLRSRIFKKIVAYI